MMTAARNLKDACGRPPGSRDALYPPFPPTPDSGGEASRAPQYPVPPSRHSRHQPSLATWNLPGLGREGKEAAEREGESLVNMQWGDSATPRSRPLPNDPSLPSHPVSLSFSRNARLNHEGSWWRPNWPLQRSRLFGEVGGGRFLLDFS